MSVSASQYSTGGGEGATDLKIPLDFNPNPYYNRALVRIRIICLRRDGDGIQPVVFGPLLRLLQQDRRPVLSGGPPPGGKENALSLLYTLDNGPPCSQKQLAEELLIPKTTINTIVKEYIDAGYLSLVPSGHSREKNITLTAAGRAYAQKVLRPIYQAEERAISRTLGEYSSEFVKAVEVLTRNMTQEFQREIFDRTELK